jgi:hypothetical protein
VHSFDIESQVLLLSKIAPMRQSQYPVLVLDERFVTHRGREWIVLQPKSGVEVDAQVKQSPAGKGIQCGVYISSVLLRTRPAISYRSIYISGRTPTRGIISAGSVTSLWASSSLKEMRWAISTSQ